MKLKLLATVVIIWGLLATTDYSYGKDITLTKSVKNKILSIAAAAGLSFVLATSQPSDAVGIGASAGYDAYNKDALVSLHAHHELDGFGIAGHLSFRDLKELDSYDYGIGLSKELPIGVKITAGYYHPRDYRTLVNADLTAKLEFYSNADGEFYDLEFGVGLLGDDFSELEKVFYWGANNNIRGWSFRFRTYMRLYPHKGFRRFIMKDASISYDILDNVGMLASYEHHEDKGTRTLLKVYFDFINFYKDTQFFTN